MTLIERYILHLIKVGVKNAEFDADFEFVEKVEKYSIFQSF
jgi:hypothetical protein